MTDKIARVCDYCGKADVLNNHADSNGMILIEGDNVHLLLMRNLREKEIARPSFNLNSKAYCPECLPKEISDWIRMVK